jgi:hypothetical protein
MWLCIKFCRSRPLLKFVETRLPVNLYAVHVKSLKDLMRKLNTLWDLEVRFGLREFFGANFGAFPNFRRLFP